MIQSCFVHFPIFNSFLLPLGFIQGEVLDHFDNNLYSPYPRVPQSQSGVNSAHSRFAPIASNASPTLISTQLSRRSHLRNAVVTPCGKGVVSFGRRSVGGVGKMTKRHGGTKGRSSSEAMRIAYSWAKINEARSRVCEDGRGG